MKEADLSSNREKLGTDIVRAQFGEVRPEIIEKSEYERVCITRTQEGLAGSYTVVYFNKEGTKAFASVHEKIKKGRFIGESFRALGIPFIRDEECSFIYLAPLPLARIFDTPKALFFAKRVDLKAGESSTPYASIIELYAPRIGFSHLEEKSSGTALMAANQLDSHFSVPSHYFIRGVAQRDLDNYLSLAHEFLRKPMHVGIPDKKEFVSATKTTCEKVLADQNTITLVAQHENEFIGYVTANIHPALHVNGLECMLRELYVKEQYRRKGVGSTLLQALERIAKAREAKRISGATNMSDPTQRTFYTETGYRRRCDFISKCL